MAMPMIPVLGEGGERHKNHWSLLSASLTPGSVKDPVSKNKAESEGTGHLTSSSGFCEHHTPVFTPAHKLVCTTHSYTHIYIYIQTNEYMPKRKSMCMCGGMCMPWQCGELRDNLQQSVHSFHQVRSSM